MDKGRTRGRQNVSGGTSTYHHSASALTRTNKTNSVALSPRANYTDWETATCQRNLVPTSVDRRVSRGQRSGSPTVVNLSFLDRSCYYSFKLLLIYPHNGWVDTVLDPLLHRKSGSTGNRTRDLCYQPGTMTTRPQRRWRHQNSP
jgi:hypothetical protein